MENDNDNDRGSCMFQHGTCGSWFTQQKKLNFTNTKPNIGIMSAYNDMLSAHKPLENFPNN